MQVVRDWEILLWVLNFHFAPIFILRFAKHVSMEAEIFVQLDFIDLLALTLILVEKYQEFSKGAKEIPSPSCSLVFQKTDTTGFQTKLY